MSSGEQMADAVARKLREEGLTQAAFCRKAGVSQKHMSQVLRGETAAPLATLDYWAFLLGSHFEIQLVDGIRA